MKTRIVYVDVEEKLMRRVGTTRIPMPAVVAREWIYCKYSLPTSTDAA